MVFGILSKRGSHDAAYRKIKTGRAELAFVVSVGVKIYQPGIIGRVPENATKCLIDLRISASSSLISKPTSVSDTGDHEPVFDLRNARFVESQPGDGSNGAWDEQKTVRIPARFLEQVLCQEHRQRYSGKVIVA